MEHLLEFREKDTLVSRIRYNDKDRIILSIENNPYYPSYYWLIPKDGNYDMLIASLSARVIPEERYLRYPEGQRVCGSIEYDPFKICKYTHGVTGTDHFWIWFDTDDANLKYDNVRIRGGS